MIKKILLPFLFFSIVTYAQVEKPPVYLGCENEITENLEACLNNSLKTDVLKSFKVPDTVIKDNYKGQIKIIFNVTKEGEFDILYVNAMYPELGKEAKRVFATLPRITPATYNGRAIDTRYILPLSIPLNGNSNSKNTIVVTTAKIDIQDQIQETVKITNSLFPEFNSELNIPLNHQGYDEMGAGINAASNSHTASKPYLYNEVKPYVDLESDRTKILYDKKTWVGRKLFNEHLALVKGEDYWFTLNPVWDLQLGKDNSDIDYTYNNTRGLQIQGALGKKFSFSTSFYESQGRFAQYFNEETRRLNPIIAASALVPGRGKAKAFKDQKDAFDYPVAEAYISYTPNKFFNFQFGNGKNFIGDGYRSFFLSDVASPYPFLKISTNFWKIKYTNLWMWMDDIRQGTTDDGTNFRKYVAMHHLSWNVTKKFNLGLFESVITNQNSYNGFDISFFNPIIFYRAIEFSNGGDGSGNVQLGLNMKYKITKDLLLYDQFLIDEMTVDRVFDGSGYWGNKFAIQLGAKYFNAFKVKNLMLQFEYNWARPYTFSHGDPLLNSGHYNQAISHLWGANFWETIGIVRYSKNRWFANAKLIVGKKGFDFEGSEFSNGGDIYRSYNERESGTGNEVAQGNTTDIFIGDLQAGYVLNPTTNLQIFGGFTYRNFTPLVNDSVASKDSTTWITFGVKANLFNWYFDF